MEWIILFFIGLIAGAIGSLVGIGGGIIIVPSLLYVATIEPHLRPMTPQIAVGTSLLLIALTSLSSVLTFHRQKRIDFKSGYLFFITAGPSSMIGAYLSKYFSIDTFLIGFGLFLVILFFIMMFQDKIKPLQYRKGIPRTFVDSTGQEYQYGYHLPTALLLSIVVGLFSGLFGIGGGALLVPMMVLLFQFPAHVATATSMFVILLSSIMGSATHIVQGHISWLGLILLAPGSWIGGKLGAKISAKMSNRTLLLVFRTILVLVALRMILTGSHLL